MFNSHKLRRIEAKLNIIIRLLEDTKMAKVEDAIVALQAQVAKNVGTEGAAVSFISALPASNDEANAAAIDAVTASLAPSETALAAAVAPMVPEPVPAPPQA